MKIVFVFFAFCSLIIFFNYGECVITYQKDVPLDSTDWKSDQSVSNMRYYIQDLMVQGICSGSTGFERWIYAVRRECNPSSSRTCDDICGSSELKEQDPDLVDTEGSCFGVFHVYHDRPIIYKDEMLGPKTFATRECSTKGCGPNYCCCQFIPKSSNGNLKGINRNEKLPSISIIY